MLQHFSDRLLQLRKQMGISQEELGRQMHVTKATVSLWENGTLPRDDKRPRLAKVLGTTEPYLFDGIDTHKEASGASIMDSDGAGYMLVRPLDDTTLGTIKLSRSTYATANVNPASSLYLFMPDTSMHPLIPNASLIVIDQQSVAPVNGKLYAVQQGNETRIAYVYRLPNKSIRLRFENDDEYPQEILKPNDELYPNILGRVFWYAVTLPI